MRKIMPKPMETRQQRAPEIMPMASRKQRCQQQSREWYHSWHLGESRISKKLIGNSVSDKLCLNPAAYPMVSNAAPSHSRITFALLTILPPHLSSTRLRDVVLRLHGFRDDNYITGSDRITGSQRFYFSVIVPGSGGLTG